MSIEISWFRRTSPIYERNFLLASSDGSAVFLVSGFAEGEEAVSNPHHCSGLVTGVVKPLKHKEFPGFLSAAQIVPHYSAHYGRALRLKASN